MRRWLLWLPLGLFVLVLVLAASGLIAPKDPVIKSAMVGKDLPTFSLPPLVQGKPGLGSATFREGGPRLLNVFASWCVPCAAEAPQLMRLKAMGVPIDAVAIRDTGPAVTAFLQRYGDPYDRIGNDRQSSVQLAIGSSGVPETFVIDGRGKIVLQHIGDIREEDVAGILDALESAR